MRRVLRVQVLAVSMFGMISCLLCGTYGVAFAATVEIANGPKGLLELEQRDQVTVRALRAWGRLPESYMKLAQQLRQESGLDILGSDLTQINTWINQAEGGDVSLANHLAELRGLAEFMQGGMHLDWQPAPTGVSMPAGTLLRSGGTRWKQAADGPVAAPGATAQVEPAQGEPAVTAGIKTTPAQPPAAPGDAGPLDGVEFPINDQVPGTYKVKLQVEGLSTAGAEDAPYFQRRLQAVVPGSSAVREGEQRYFDKLAEYMKVKPVLEDDTPYNLVLGFATPDTPVVIRVDAPENPEIALSEQEIRDRVTYRVAGKSVYVYRHDEAAGDADIGFEESNDGVVRWTPRADAGSGRPVGPRVLGIYMSYKIRKYVGDNELGTLSTSQHRIGWVVVAMPGDVYEHEGALYAVGQDESLSTGGVSGPVAAADNFDFELSQYALDEGAIRLSDDLRHVAWVEGEKKGQKRVIVNGVAGKWYDDVKNYDMGFTPGGESFCFRAEMGEKELLVCNGVDGPVFDDIDFVAMSPDGAHVLVGGNAGGTNLVYLDGKRVRQTANRVREGAVASNGKAAWVERGRNEQTGTEFAMVVTAEGVEGQKYPAIHGNLHFTKNRAELYYIAEKEDKMRFLVRDSEELKPTMGYGYKFTVTEDGAYYSYVGYQADTVRSMVVNGTIGDEFNDIWNPAIFSADGARHIYSAKRGEEAFLVVDGQVVSHGFGPLKSVIGETFSPDGSRWAAGFQLSGQEYVVVVDGKEVGRGQGSPRKIVFSPDGARVGWLEKQKKSWKAYVDGQAGPEFREIYDDEPPQFSPDGKSFVYFARDKDNKMHIVVFGGEDKVHDIIPPRAVFTSSGVEYLAIDGNRFRKHAIALP